MTQEKLLFLERSQQSKCMIFQNAFPLSNKFLRSHQRRKKGLFPEKKAFRLRYQPKGFIRVCSAHFNLLERESIGASRSVRRAEMDFCKKG